MRLLSARARETGLWLLQECRRCPKGYGMSLDYSPTDTLDVSKLVQAALLWDQRTKRQRALARRRALKPCPG